MFALLFFIADVTLSGTDSKFLPIYENIRYENYDFMSQK